ncbi:hypothetical protein LJR084_007826 [Variovorax sp. LjRoot84]|uniref:hypothetical protein n=1 Tax=unclassified Variovorax TaxID=663243 RepID=UPI003ECC81CC
MKGNQHPGHRQRDVLATTVTDARVLGRLSEKALDVTSIPAEDVLPVAGDMADSEGEGGNVQDGGERFLQDMGLILAFFGCSSSADFDGTRRDSPSLRDQRGLRVPDERIVT